MYWCVIFDKLTFSGCCFLWCDVNFYALACRIMLASSLTVTLTAAEAIDSVLSVLLGCCCCFLSLPLHTLCRASFSPQGCLGPHI